MLKRSIHAFGSQLLPEAMFPSALNSGTGRRTWNRPGCCTCIPETRRHGEFATNLALEIDRPLTGMPGQAGRVLKAFAFPAASCRRTGRMGQVTLRSRKSISSVVDIGRSVLHQGSKAGEKRTCRHSHPEADHLVETRENGKG
jgi:hypothetical protein